MIKQILCILSTCQHSALIVIDKESLNAQKRSWKIDRLIKKKRLPFWKKVLSLRGVKKKIYNPEKQLWKVALERPNRRAGKKTTNIFHLIYMFAGTRGAEDARRGSGRASAREARY